MSKGKTITLKENRGGTEHKFSFAHALNLLRLQEKNGSNGWQVADKNYIFKDNEICKKPSSRTSKKADQ